MSASAVPLGEVITLEYGKPLPQSERREDGPVPVFGANGVKDTTHQPLVADAGIVVGRKGTAGAVTLTDGPFWPLDVTYYVQHDESETDRHYLYYLLQALELPRLAKGVKPGINRNDVYGLPVRIPPLDEQRRIVAKLDDATDFVSKATEAVGVARSEADALRSQILNKAFGQRVGDAPSMELKDVCRFINGRAYKKTEFLDSGPYPVLRVGNFFTNANRVYSDLELDSEKYCEAGDLLYAWSASFGPRLWAGPKAIFHYHIWKVVPNESLVLKDYLFRLLQWDVAQIRNDHGTGATMMHVTKGNMEARTVRIPALADQRAICAEVAAADLEMDALDRALAKKSSELGALLPAILNDLIAG